MNKVSIPAKYFLVCLAALLATMASFVLMTVLITAEVSRQPSIDIPHITASRMSVIRENSLPEIREKAEKILPAAMPPDPTGKIFLPETQTLTQAVYPELGSLKGLIDSDLIQPLISPPIRNLVPKNIVHPHYPFRASIREIEGYVLIQFTVRKNGTVKNPFVIESEPGRLFDEAALSAISKFKFFPRVISGEPTAVEDLKIKFSFKLNSPYVQHAVEVQS